MRGMLCIVILALVSLSAPAGDIYVPDNNAASGSCNNYPFNPTHGEWRYQCCVPTTLLGGKPVTITEIGFAPCHSVTFTAQILEIRMSHSTWAGAPSSLYASNLPNPTVVIPAGPLTWNRIKDTWCSLKLTTPFHYNGVDHLTIEVRYQGGALQGGTSSTDHQQATSSLQYYRVYSKGSGSFAATMAQSVDPIGALKLKLTCLDVQIVGSGLPAIGSSVSLLLQSPADGGLPYQVGTSLGTGPIPLGTRSLGLSLDKLLEVSVGGWLPAIFQNYAGYLDAKGGATAAMAIPQATGLIGIRLHSAFLTIKAGEPFGIKTVSPTFSFTITK